MISDSLETRATGGAHIDDPVALTATITPTATRCPTAIRAALSKPNTQQTFGDFSDHLADGVGGGCGCSSHGISFDSGARDLTLQGCVGRVEQKDVVAM